MRPVVKIIGDVVEAMKPDLSNVTIEAVGTFATFTDVAKVDIAKLFADQRIKINHSGVVKYGNVNEIFTTSFTAIFPEMNYEGMSGDPLTDAEVIINYDYGHLLELQNRFKEATQNPTFKQEQFPAIILVQDFEEEINNRKHERLATLRMFILTDSKQEYEASQRYTYTFDPILYPLEALFISELEKSDKVSIYDQDYTRIDRLYWGRVAGQGTASNIFNDFIDAIEINDLKIKILNTC